MAHQACADSSCAERDEWHYCLSRALPEDYKTQALAAFHHSVEVSGAAPGFLGWVLPYPMHRKRTSTSCPWGGGVRAWQCACPHGPTYPAPVRAWHHSSTQEHALQCGKQSNGCRRLYSELGRKGLHLASCALSPDWLLAAADPGEAGDQPRGEAPHPGACHTCHDVHELRL